MTRWLTSAAGAALASAAALTFGGQQAAAAAPQQPIPPIIGGEGEPAVIAKIADALAAGDGRRGGRLICDSGYVDRTPAMGHTLSSADQAVVARGAAPHQVQGFVQAVVDAYRIAEVPRDVAVASFGIGLADLATGYLSHPTEPVGFWGNQVSIGSGILLRSAQQWAVQQPIPKAPCSGP